MWDSRGFGVVEVYFQPDCCPRGFGKCHRRCGGDDLNVMLLRVQKEAFGQISEHLLLMVRFKHFANNRDKTTGSDQVWEYCAQSFFDRCNDC